MITLTINGQEVKVEQGATVLDGANKLGIYIPQLCKDPEQKPLGACRTCLVQIEGKVGFPPSCATLAGDGMIVHTDTPAVRRMRRGILELTQAMHRQDTHQKYGQQSCELEVAAERHQITTQRFEPHLRISRDESNPFFVIDMERCILCGRCIVACDKVQHIGALAFINRGVKTKVGTFADEPLIKSVSTNCGQCVAACPVGAITPRKQTGNVTREVSTVCPYCGVGCGITLQVDEQRQVLVNSLDSPSNISSQGMLCVKGRFGFEFVNHPERLTVPLIKRGGVFEEASWDEALGLVAAKLVEHRGEFAALASAKATNEDGYVMQKFVRGVMGTNNIDHCQRLCHSSSVEALLSSLGGSSTSNSYGDYEKAGCLMIVGSDPSSNHPVIDARLRRTLDGRQAKIIVVNPKKIALCYYADIWLRPLPGTDIALFNGLARIIIDEGLWDKSFVESRTENFEMWRQSLLPYSPEKVARLTGVPIDDMRAAAKLYAQPARGGSCLLWGMGMTQHTSGTKNVQTLLNLALLTGQIGKPGSGISPLRGQNNVQGCSDVGCLPQFLPGYQPIAPAGLDRFSQAWGLPLSGNRGLTLTEMIDAAHRGQIKAVYSLGENPLLTEPNIGHAREALLKLEFLVVQDIFLHETARIADVVLPAASFAEKEGTFTNSERRVQRVRKVIEPVGQSRADWEIICDLARRICAQLGVVSDQFSYKHPEQIFREMAASMPQLSGMTYERLADGGLQWPCPTEEHYGTQLLYADSFPRGRGRFTVVEQGPAASELPNLEYPLLLNTGRMLYHWHGGTMSQKVKGLATMMAEPTVSVNTEDAKALGVNYGDRVIVMSRRGEIAAQAVVTEAVRRGEVFMPFVAFGQSAANFLTNGAYDPDSRIPEYKACAVRIEKA